MSCSTAFALYRLVKVRFLGVCPSKLLKKIFTTCKFASTNVYLFLLYFIMDNEMDFPEISNRSKNFTFETFESSFFVKCYIN